MKTCPKCGKEKHVADFPKDKSSKDGLYSYCKECCSSRSRNTKPTVYGNMLTRKKARDKTIHQALIVKHGIAVVEAMESTEFDDHDSDDVRNFMSLR